MNQEEHSEQYKKILCMITAINARLRALEDILTPVVKISFLKKMKYKYINPFLKMKYKYINPFLKGCRRCKPHKKRIPSWSLEEQKKAYEHMKHLQRKSRTLKGDAWEH